MTDPNGLAWACGTISATLINSNGVSATLNGQVINGFTAPVKLGCPTDPTTSRTAGFFQMQLADNTQIKCGIATCGTQTTWQFTVNTTGIAPPQGTGPQSFSQTFTISGTTQTLSFTGVPTLSLSSSSGASNVISLSPNCAGATAPCFGIPSGGGCVSNLSVTGGNNVVTFNGTFPAGAKVGQVAWVQIEHGGGQCLTIETPPISGTPSGPIGEQVYCGAARTAGGTQITITAVNQGASTVTLSQNCGLTLNSSNLVFFYGPNIYSQMTAACSAAASNNNVVKVAAGFYVLDNTGNGSNRSCGGAGGIAGEAVEVTYLVTPPWYNHELDLGTVFSIGGPGYGILSDFTLDLTWTALNVTLGRGTPLYINSCGHVDRVALRGMFFGTGFTSEWLYPNIAPVVNNTCYISNSQILGSNRGIENGAGGRIALVNDYIFAGSNLYFTASANFGVLDINGGTYVSLLLAPDAGFFALPASGGGSIAGDSVLAANALLCMGTNNSTSQTAPLFNIGASETSGAIRFNNVRALPNCFGSGSSVNWTMLTVPTGWTAQLTMSNLTAAGTGNTVNNSGTIYQDLQTLQNTSGGAGYTGAGTNHHVETGTCTFAAATTCSVTFTQGFGSSPSFQITPVNPGAVTFTVTALSATSATITASGANSLAVGWNASL